MKEKKILNFFTPKKENGLGQWLAEEGISAGFPSPADDFKETRISLDRELVKNKEATFYARVSGDSMIGAGLDDGDLLIIDRSKKSWKWENSHLFSRWRVYGQENKKGKEQTLFNARK